MVPKSIDDSYTDFSLNIGGEWGTGAYGFPAGNPIDLTQNESANMLYGKWGLTTSWGASMFLYGELSESRSQSITPTIRALHTRSGQMKP